MEVLEQLRRHLECDRDNGITFPDAWPAALERALLAEPVPRERRNWQAALSGTRSSWACAFAGAPASPGVQACELLLEAAA